MFKTLFPLLCLLFCCTNLSAQRSVERSVSGLQFNLVKLAYYNETGISDKLAIRFEAGAGIQLQGRNFGTVAEVDLNIQPYALVEPRYYYNFAQREEKGKRTTNNSGNYVGLKTIYNLPFHLVTTNDDNINPNGRLSIIPRWGIRRDLGSGWDFELGLGTGLAFETRRTANGNPLLVGQVLDISWRFGFRF